MGRKHRGKKAVKPLVKESVVKIDKDSEDTITSTTTTVTTTTTTISSDGGVSDGDCNSSSGSKNSTSSSPPLSPKEREKYLPLFLRRPIPSASEQPSRFSTPPAPTLAYGYGFNQNGLATWPLPTGPAETVPGGLPTISWLCSCELCVNSVQEFIAALNNTNGQYAACISTSGPVYNDLVASGVHFPSPTTGKLMPPGSKEEAKDSKDKEDKENKENKENTEEKETTSTETTKTATKTTITDTTKDTMAALKKSMPRPAMASTAINGFVTDAMPFYPLPVATHGFMGPDGIMYFSSNYWPPNFNLAYLNGFSTYPPMGEIYSDDVDANGGTSKESGKLQIKVKSATDKKASDENGAEAGATEAEENGETDGKKEDADEGSQQNGQGEERAIGDVANGEDAKDSDDEKAAAGESSIKEKADTEKNAEAKEAVLEHNGNDDSSVTEAEEDADEEKAVMISDENDGSGDEDAAESEKEQVVNGSAVATEDGNANNEEQNEEDDDDDVFYDEYASFEEVRLTDDSSEDNAAAESNDFVVVENDNGSFMLARKTVNADINCNEIGCNENNENGSDIARE